MDGYTVSVNGHTLLHKCYEAFCIQLKSMALILHCLYRHNRTFCHISGLVHNNDIKEMDDTSPLLPTTEKGLYTRTQLLPGSTGRAQLSLIMFHKVVVWHNSYEITGELFFCLLQPTSRGQSRPDFKAFCVSH